MPQQRNIMRLADRRAFPASTAQASREVIDFVGPADLGATLLEIVDHLDAMVAYWSAERVCLFANATYLDWFGKPRSQIIGRSMQALLGPLYEMNKPYIDAALAGRKQVFERDIPVPGGGMRPSLATYTPHIRDGEVVGMFVHVADVSPLKGMERELREAKALAESNAMHDPLTGLPNRRLLTETIDRAISLSARTGETLALASIDIDHFKSISDQHGHAAGDHTLVEIAARLRAGLRACGPAIRSSGSAEMNSSRCYQHLARQRMRSPWSNDFSMPAISRCGCLTARSRPP